MRETNLGTSAITLEFFAELLLMRGIIDIETEEDILSATSVPDLDKIIDRLAQEVSGD